MTQEFIKQEKILLVKSKIEQDTILISFVIILSLSLTLKEKAVQDFIVNKFKIQVIPKATKTLSNTLWLSNFSVSEKSQN